MYSTAVVLIALLATVAAQQKCGQASVAPPDDGAILMASRAARSSIKTGQALVGGTQADYGVWPWTVSICIWDWFGNCEYQSAGAIIDKNWVITTISGIELAEVHATLRVRAGSINWNKNGQFIKVRQYFKPNDGSDIALLQLESPLIFNDYTQPICLPFNDTDVVHAGGSAWFTSWGAIKPTLPTIQTNLQQGRLSISNNSVCDGAIVKTNPVTQVCAGGYYVNGGTATCSFDIGGPLMQQRDGTWYLFGLSQTKNYAASNCKEATLFTRVSTFCKWVSTFSGLSCTGETDFEERETTKAPSVVQVTDQVVPATVSV